MANDHLYWARFPEEPLRIVCARSWAKAAHHLNTTVYLLKTYGGLATPDNPVHLAIDDAVQQLARSKAGIVFEMGPSGWQQVGGDNGLASTDAKPAKQNTPIRVVKLTDDEKAALQARGGVTWLRSQIDAYRGESITPGPRPLGIEHAQVSVRLSNEHWSRYLSLGGIHWLREQLQ